MAMAFNGGGRVPGLFGLPPRYSTPGIGDELPVGGNTPASDSMPQGLGFFGVPRFGAQAMGDTPVGPSPASAPASGFPALPAPVVGGFGPPAGGIPNNQGSPISLMPLDMPLQKPIMPEAQPGPEFVPMAPLPGIAPKKPGFFGKGGAGWDVIGTIGDALSAAGGGRPAYWPMKIHQRQQQAEWDRQDALRRQDRQWAVDDRDYKANRPRYFASGRDQVEYDPATDMARVIYDGPADFEEYASTLGLEPGTDEYNEAVQDFQLRGNGPTAQAGRREMETLRQGNRVSLEGVRQQNRAALRGMPTYANLHPRPAAAGGGGHGGPPRSTGNVYAPILAKMAAGQTLTPGEQQVIGLYGRGGRSGRTGTSSSGGGNPIATDAKGNKVQYDPASKSWRPVR